MLRELVIESLLSAGSIAKDAAERYQDSVEHLEKLLNPTDNTALEALNSKTKMVEESNIELNKVEKEISDTLSDIRAITKVNIK